ncbi:hypothetical protein MFMK1_001913 [Metallumcola ferriviriculae]|uniref:Uncharacterized protein n=1 Tax=Metallumcola ferriviriculae TaxID=3039180 RepID=A0AAU0UMD9_9FIRM|nr:hypothetical protein MFMK1_001913 [Desulfitibacteraceae bacterium MK1]
MPALKPGAAGPQKVQAEKISNQLKQTIGSLKKTLLGSNEISAGQVNRALDEGKYVVENFVQYQQTLGTDLDDMRELTSLLKRQMRKF